MWCSYPSGLLRQSVGIPFWFLPKQILSTIWVAFCQFSEHFLHRWSLVRGVHQSPVNSCKEEPIMQSLMFTWTKWIADDLMYHQARVMPPAILGPVLVVICICQETFADCILTCCYCFHWTWHLFINIGYPIRQVCSSHKTSSDFSLNMNFVSTLPERFRTTSLKT